MQRGRNNDLTKLNHHPSSFSSDRIEEKNNFISSCEQLRVGDHLIWEQVDPQSYTGSRLENVLKLPKEKRLSCLIDINFPYKGRDHYCFLFDEPFNIKPSEAERSLAQINQQNNYLPHLFLIAESTWKSQGIVLSYAKSISNKSFVKCKLENCIQIGQRYRFVSVCDIKFHYCCQVHFIPIGEDNIQWCDEIRNYLVTRCSNHCLNSPSPYLEVGVQYLYLMFRHFKKMNMKRLASLITESNSFLCPFCLENEKENFCRLDVLEQQLKNPTGFVPPEGVAEINEEEKKESKLENHGHEGNVDKEDEINYDRTDPYARKVTEGIKRSNSFKSDPEKHLGLQPEADKSVDFDETGIPFRQTRKWNNLSNAAKRRLLDWEQYLEKDYYAKREEVEAIYQQQSGFELEEITLQVLKVLIASSREKSMAAAARRLGPLSSSRDAANTNLSNLNQNTLKSSLKRIDSYDGMPLANPLRIRSIEIKVCQPEKPDMIKTVHFITDLTYDEILRKCCEALLIFMDWRSMSLVKRNADGWNERIYAEKSYPFHDSYGESICGTINDQDIIEVRRTTGAFLGGRYYLQSIVDSYQQNASIQQKISQLNSNYIGYREIRGDGNCYYRSIFCGIIECLISAQDITKREEGFQYLFDTFCSISYRAPPMSHTSLLRILQAAAANRKWITIAEFEADILDEASGLDEIAIYNCKRLIIDYILLYKEKEFNGITIENAILYTNEKYERSLINYCQEEILKMEICAEGVHVDLGILPCLLGSKCEIIYLDREENNQLTIRETNGLPLQKEIASISLLFRPGHYDLLYKRHEPLIATPPMIKNVQALNKPFSNPTPRCLSESREVVAPTDISPRDSNHFNMNRALLDSSSVVAETSGNVIDGSRKEPISTRKPEIAASPAKLSSAEMDALIDTLKEDDFSLAFYRESIKTLLEMGFSLEIILDVWVKYRSTFFRYDDLLERCIALAEDKEKSQVEEERASAMLKESMAKPTSFEDAIRGLENINKTTKDIGNDSFSVANQRNSVGKLRLTQDRMEAKDLIPNAIEKTVEFPPVSRIERQASKEFEITEEERELLARASRENSFASVTWKSIEQTAIEIQREYHYPLQDILNVILKNPFQKNKTPFIRELERLSKLQSEKPTLEPNRSDNDNQMADRNGLKSYSKKEIPDGTYSLAIPLPDKSLDPNTTPNTDTERNSIYSTITPSLPLHSTSKENTYPAMVVQEQKRQHSSPNSEIIVPSDLKDLSHTSALSPGPKVSLLVDKFNQKPNPTSPDRRSNTSSPGGDVSKTPRKGSQTVSTPKGKEEKSTEDELFELFLAKQNYPKLGWHYAEEAAKEVFANYHVPMKLIIEAIREHGALFPESIRKIIETKLNFILEPKSSDERRDHLGTLLDYRKPNNLTKNEANNEKKQNEDSSMLEKKSSKEVITPRSARLNSEIIDISAGEKQVSVSKYDSIKQDNKQREILSTSIPKNEEINRRDKIVSLPIGAADKNNNPLFALHSSVVNLKTNEIPSEYQLNYFSQDFVPIFNYLVYDLQLPARVAKDAIESFSCHNLRSAIIASKTLIAGGRPYLRDLAPREKDPKLDNQMKEIIFKTVREFGYSVDDILDAIVYDRCLVIEDIVDVMESKQMMKQRNQRDIEDKNTSPNSKGKEKTVDFLSADQELDIQQYLDRLDSFNGGGGFGGSPRTFLTTNNYLTQKYPTMATGELNRRHSSDYPTPATGYGSQKNQLGKPFSSTPRGNDSIGNESSAFSRSSSSNHNNRNCLIDDRLLKIWIKQLERNDVMKELKKRGLLEEKITGESTRCLRELLYRHLVTLMGR